jgi:hypothetical protein
MDTITAGYIYLLINRSMPGLVKVGRTTRAPATRVAELSAATGVPAPFELVYDILVPDAARAESILHDALTSRGFRTSPSREFFEVPIHEVVKLMIQVREAAESSSVRVVGATVKVDDHADVDVYLRDSLFRQAAELCVRHREGSTKLLQDGLRIGYGRAARIIDQLHDAGALGPPDGPNPREVLITAAEVDRVCGDEDKWAPEPHPEPEPEPKRRGWFGQ